MSALAPERVRPAPRPAPARSPQPKATPPRLHLITRASPEVRARRAPKTPFVILLLVLLAGGLMGLLLLNTMIDQDAFALHDLQSKQTVLDVQEAQLHEQANSNADPAALAAKAAALGMVPAGPPTFVKKAELPKGGTLVGNLYLVKPKPGTPAAAPATTPAAVAPAPTTTTPAPTTTAPTTTATTTPATTATATTPASPAPTATPSVAAHA